MRLSVAVFKIENDEAPGVLDSKIEADAIAHEVELRGHQVERWRVHVHHIESLVEELDCALFLIEALVPRDMLRRLHDRVTGRPWALFGPLAATLFEHSPAPFAFVGASRIGAGKLADRLAESADHSRSGSDFRELLEGANAVSNLLARIRPDARIAREDSAPLESLASEVSAASSAWILEASTAWRVWDFESELLPFSASSAQWNYRGPALRPSFGTAPLLAERGCVHGHSDSAAVATGTSPVSTGTATATTGDAKATEAAAKATAAAATATTGDATTGTGRNTAITKGATGVPTPARDHDPLASPWSERARTRLLDHHAAQSCPYGICPAPAAISLEQVNLQSDHLWSQGVRSFEIRAVHPLPALKSLLEHLAKEDKVPEQIRFRPSPRSLRQSEAGLLQIFEQHPRVRFHLAGLEFFLAGRALGQTQFDTSQWEARSIARLLRRLDDRAPNLDATIEHTLHLFDPYTTLEEILDALQVIEEDAPFLKAALSTDRPLLIASRLSPIARRIEQDGLLSQDGPFGLGYRFASDEIPVYRDLASRGLAPLLEAIGRLRLPPPERDRLAVEGRFRWFRELARFVISRRRADRPPTDGWGQVLAGVTRDLGLDQLRRR